MMLLVSKDFIKFKQNNNKIPLKNKLGSKSSDECNKKKLKVNERRVDHLNLELPVMK
jgi:hypothetical protein